MQHSRSLCCVVYMYYRICPWISANKCWYRNERGRQWGRERERGGRSGRVREKWVKYFSLTTDSDRLGLGHTVAVYFIYVYAHWSLCRAFSHSSIYCESSKHLKAEKKFHSKWAHCQCDDTLFLLSFFSSFCTVHFFIFPSPRLPLVSFLVSLRSRSSEHYPIIFAMVVDTVPCSYAAL